jgi:hypothetical protein
MPMGYEQCKPPQNNLNAPSSGRIKIESEDIFISDIPGDLSQSLVYRSLIC